MLTQKHVFVEWEEKISLHIRSLLIYPYAFMHNCLINIMFLLFYFMFHDSLYPTPRTNSTTKDPDNKDVMAEVSTITPSHFIHIIRIEVPLHTNRHAKMKWHEHNKCPFIFVCLFDVLLNERWTFTLLVAPHPFLLDSSENSTYWQTWCLLWLWQGFFYCFVVWNILYMKCLINIIISRIKLLHTQIL